MVVVVVVGVVVESLAANLELNWTLNGAAGAGRKRCVELLLLRLLCRSGVSVGHTDFGTDTGFSKGRDFLTTFSTLTTASWGILSKLAKVEVD